MFSDYRRMCRCAKHTKKTIRMRKRLLQIPLKLTIDVYAAYSESKKPAKHDLNEKPVQTILALMESEQQQ
jgi:hypothetical protein